MGGIMPQALRTEQDILAEQQRLFASNLPSRKNGKDLLWAPSAQKAILADGRVGEVLILEPRYL